LPVIPESYCPDASGSIYPPSLPGLTRQSIVI
jgi:hypothetical protein